MSVDKNPIGASYAAQVAQDAAEKSPPPEATPGATSQQGGPAAEGQQAEFDLGVPEVAALAWEIGDVLICKQFGDDMALTDAEKARLVKPTVKVLEKYVGAVKLSPELALLAVAATIYASKLAAAGALDFGAPKTAPAPSSAPQTTTTTAQVDGKPVAAEVTQFQKGSAA